MARIPSLFLFCLFASLASKAQAGKPINSFNGWWVADSTALIPDEYSNGAIAINQDTIVWNIFNDEFMLNFTDSVAGDTMMLFYLSCDCSKGFKSSNIKFPKPKSLFAKCYLAGDKMSVIYVNDKFISSFNSYVHNKLTTHERYLALPPAFYPRH